MASPNGECKESTKDSDGSAGGSGRGKQLSQEQVVAGFQDLRNQQRAVISKMSEIDMERKEHELVIEALKEVDSSRRCFRMVGGVLVERTVGDVLPALNTNHEQLVKLTDVLSKQLETRGRDLQEYRDKHNIRVRGEEERATSATDSTSKTGVLVGQT